MEGWWEEGLPTMAMVALQLVYSIINLLNRAAFVNGMNPTVFVFYRMLAATLVTSPIAYFTRNTSKSYSIGLQSILLMVVTAFIGLALCQNLYNEGLYLASSSVASAISNIIPGLTFFIAAILRLEQVNIKKLSSIAKIVGTALCVGGAISMALLKGTKLLNAKLPPANSVILQSLKVDNAWLLGCLCLFTTTCCWSVWFILQVPLTARCPNHFSLSAWMCFLSMLQALAIALFFVQDPKAWILRSNLEVIACVFSACGRYRTSVRNGVKSERLIHRGIFGSGIQYCVQAWCISRKGPLFSAMFSPLSTVITTALATILLHEQVYVGTLLGAIAVITGLYVVLWGKDKEMNGNNQARQTTQENNSCKIDLEQPLLSDKSTNEALSN